jgi:hypothetical protein
MEPLPSEWREMTAADRRLGQFHGARVGYRFRVGKPQALGASIDPAASGSAHSLKPEDLHHGWGQQNFAEGVHPGTCLLTRSDTAPAKLIKLVEAGQLQLKLQSGTVVPAGDRDQQICGQPLLAGSSYLAPNEFDGPLTISRHHIVGKPSEIHAGSSWLSRIFVHMA